MRLFLAADVSAETRAQIRAAREQLQRRLEQARRPPRVAWVKDEAVHVTLRFLGEVPDTQVTRLESALGAAFPVSPFEVRWEGLGTFPGGGVPRVIWIGATDGSSLLTTLAELVSARVEAIVGASETRQFTPHLTIGRVKDSGREVGWRTVVAGVALAPTTSVIDHVTLYRSRPSPNGPTYTEIARARLE
jgi:RNA 2',3'-cyclic 3'-phosphodiesterase